MEAKIIRLGFSKETILCRKRPRTHWITTCQSQVICYRQTVTFEPLSVLSPGVLITEVSVALISDIDYIGKQAVGINIRSDLKIPSETNFKSSMSVKPHADWITTCQSQVISQ